MKYITLVTPLLFLFSCSLSEVEEPENARDLPNQLQVESILDCEESQFEITKRLCNSEFLIFENKEYSMRQDGIYIKDINTGQQINLGTLEGCDSPKFIPYNKDVYIRNKVGLYRIKDSSTKSVLRGIEDHSIEHVIDISIKDWLVMEDGTFLFTKDDSESVETTVYEYDVDSNTISEYFNLETEHENASLSGLVETKKGNVCLILKYERFQAAIIKFTKSTLISEFSLNEFKKDKPTNDRFLMTENEIMVVGNYYNPMIYPTDCCDNNGVPSEFVVSFSYAISLTDEPNLVYKKDNVFKGQALIDRGDQYVIVGSKRDIIIDKYSHSLSTKRHIAFEHFNIERSFRFGNTYYFESKESEPMIKLSCE